jgi:hypothetical protein
MHRPAASPRRTATISVVATLALGSVGHATEAPSVERFQAAPWRGGDGRTRAVVVVDRPWSHHEASAFAAALGGQLASISSNALLGFVTSLCDLEGAFDCEGPWLGGARPALGAWTWQDGSAFDGFGFAIGRPAQALAVPAALVLSGSATASGGGLADGTWLDALPSPDAGTVTRSAVIEWTTFVDCDADGYPDLLEIAVDAALDSDADGALDACTGNPADLDGDGSVGAGDLAVLLDAWGDKGAPGTLPADLTGDGRVDAADLAALLAVWGSAG